MEDQVRNRNLAFGLFTGPIVILAFYGAIAAIATRPIDISDELPFILFQMLWVSIPFVVVMLHNPRSLVPWAVSIGLTFLIYGYSIFDALIRARDLGPNIGLGLLIFLWPLLVTMISLAVIRSGGGERR